MNEVRISGWVAKESWIAYTRAGQPKLLWDLVVNNPDPAPAVGTLRDLTTSTPYRCEFEGDKAEVYRLRDQLDGGTGLELVAQLSGSRFEDDGVQTGFKRFLLVREFLSIAERGRALAAPSAPRPPPGRLRGAMAAANDHTLEEPV
jgi:hypothetical protein